MCCGGEAETRFSYFFGATIPIIRMWVAICVQDCLKEQGFQVWVDQGFNLSLISNKLWPLDHIFNSRLLWFLSLITWYSSLSLFRLVWASEHSKLSKHWLLIFWPLSCHYNTALMTISLACPIPIPFSVYFCVAMSFQVHLPKIQFW